MTNNETACKTIRLKVKPDAWPWLDQAAREINYVWNWANATTHKAAHPFSGPRRILTGFDVDSLTRGCSEGFARIGANTVSRVVLEHAWKRRQARRSKLRWRASAGSRKSLGWVPFKGADLKRSGRALRLYGKTFRLFDAARLEGYKLRSGQFSQNALGEWFITVAVDIAASDSPAAPLTMVGIDLGLKAVATTSDGETLPALMAYRSLQPKLAQAQRRGHKRQAKRLHAQAANRRADAIHKFSTGIIRSYQHVVVGDVSPSKLARTSFAKAVNDSGWGMLRTQLLYKGQWAGRSVEVVNERNTTRTCSACGAVTGPAGRTGLVVREWTCPCGVTHDRDVNAARNILALSQRRPCAGTRGLRAATADGHPDRAEANPGPTP